MQQTAYLSPVSGGFWRAARARVGNLRAITFAALMVAAHVVISSFFVTVGENLRVYFTFIPMILCSIVCGPVLAPIAAVAADLIGFFLHPSGAFFAGYTLSALLGAFIYAIFLYRSKVSIVKLALSKLIVNVVVNAAIGSIWSTMLMNKGYMVFFTSSIVKNLSLWPIEVALMTLILGVLMPVLSRMGMLETKQSGRIPII